MKVIRWSVVAAVAVAAAVLAAPAAAAQPAAPAVPPAAALPAPAGRIAVGMVSPGTEILTFNTADVTHAAKAKLISGLGGDRLVGIDYRPSDHKLYGVSQQGVIFRVDDQTAAATRLGALSVPLNGSTAGEGKGFDIDFTPDGRTLRIVSDLGQNLHQAFGATGSTGRTVTDGKLSRPTIAAMAYDDGGRVLDIDTRNDQIVLQNPTTGAITDLGPRHAFPPIYSLSNGIDVVGADSFAVVNLTHHHTLFSVDITRGTVVQLGEFPDHVLDIALKR